MLVCVDRKAALVVVMVEVEVIKGDKGLDERVIYRKWRKEIGG